MDQAPHMLVELKREYEPRMHQIELVEASCLDWPSGLHGFDYVISILCVHHFAPETKVDVYRSFRNALNPQGAYVEGDQTVSLDDEQWILGLYKAWIEKLPGGSRGEWNYDVTLSLETNQHLIEEAGFGSFEVRWSGNGHVFVARE